MASCLEQSRKVLWKCCSFPAHCAHHDFDKTQWTLVCMISSKKGSDIAHGSAWNRRDALLSWPTQFLMTLTCWQDAFKELTSDGRFNKFKQATLQIIVSQHLWRVSLRARGLRFVSSQPVQQSLCRGWKPKLRSRWSTPSCGRAPNTKFYFVLKVALCHFNDFSLHILSLACCWCYCLASESTG